MFFRMILKIWTDLSSILSQSTRLTDGRTDADRQTDRIPIARPLLHCMQRGNSWLPISRPAYAIYAISPWNMEYSPHNWGKHKCFHHSKKTYVGSLMRPVPTVRFPTFHTFPSSMNVSSSAGAAVSLSIFSLNWKSSLFRPQRPCPLHWQW